MPCQKELDCGAEEHEATCPWHPDNLDVIVLPADVFDRLVKELDEPPKELPRLRALLQERQPRWAEEQ